jgi:hypothetical protein
MKAVDPKERWIKGFKWNPELRPTHPQQLRQDKTEVKN